MSVVLPWSLAGEKSLRGKWKFTLLSHENEFSLYWGKGSISESKADGTKLRVPFVCADWQNGNDKVVFCCGLRSMLGSLARNTWTRSTGHIWPAGTDHCPT